MKIETAIGLISDLEIKGDNPQFWLDLGAGEGTFTKALAHVLPENSEILAIDQSASSLRNIPAKLASTHIKTQAGDFSQIPDGLAQLDGIMMANAIHYVQDKASFLQTWIDKFEASFLIIEYDTDRSNSWVPYPIKPQALEELFAELGYHQFEKLGEIPSLYHNKIYAAHIRP
ncbi:MAG: class I SAM-dependent methyltransferase [Bacteroidia bacterium]|nr:class I SAM-dependent methyltransferase [Bacteroidia bacterium]